MCIRDSPITINFNLWELLALVHDIIVMRSLLNLNLEADFSFLNTNIFFGRAFQLSPVLAAF